MKKEGRKIKKKLIILLIVFIMIIGAVVLATKINQIGNSEKSMIGTEEMKNNKISEIGEQGIITSAQIIGTKTGTAPFDADDNPGNDSSENNNIVRSFDQIEWTIDLTMGLKSGATSSNLKGGRINVEVTLPEACKNVVEWKLEGMEWLEVGSVSEDGITLTGYYDMSEEEITIPGKQTLSFVLDIYGAGNKTEIIPTFIFGLEGNSASDRKTISGEKILVSAIGKYNVQLEKNSNLAFRTSVDYGQGNVSGRMYGYNFIIQLYNENVEKGLKGIEYPKGDITFDINLKLERTKANSSELEDITNECTPILWNYRLNDWTHNTKGYIADREMFKFSNNYHLYNLRLPLGIYVEDRFSTYDSGEVQIIQENNILHITIKNYNFNGKFPHYEANYNGAIDSGRDKIYNENIGVFNVSYLQIFVPEDSYSTTSNRKYFFTVSDSNLKMTTLSGDKISSQIFSDDDTIKISHLQYSKGYLAQQIIPLENDKKTLLESYYSVGDGKATANGTIYISSKLITGSSNDDDLYTFNRFFKFDADGFEPVYNDNGDKYEFDAPNIPGNPVFRVWYVTKKDGTNWSSQTEMNNTNIEDVDIYDNIEDIPENKLCVGIYFENVSGYICRAIGSTGHHLRFPLKIKSTAKIGQTYGMTQSTKVWAEQLDRNIYSILHPENKYPTPLWESGNPNYVKTEYDSEGNIIEGTNLGGFTYGNTILVVGANLHGNIAVLDENNKEKLNYDLGKNENKVKYQISPNLDKNKNLSVQISGVTLKAKITLPKGLSYIERSCEYGEPEITTDLSGNQILIWRIYNCKAGENINPITFETQILNESANGTQYTAKFVISEDTDDYNATKIGNSEINFRTSTVTINVINLTSHRLYAEVDKNVLENNNELKYTIVYENRTENIISEFQLLDILPYTGDKRGSRFSGNYTVKNINIKSNLNGNGQTTSNMNLYTTNSDEVKTITAKDTNIGISNIWVQRVIGSEINEEVKGIAVKGEISGKERIEIEIIIKTNGNKSKDIYINNAMAQISSKSEQIETGKVETIVVEKYLQKEVEVSTIITASDNMSGISELKYGWSNSKNEQPNEYINVDGILTSPIKIRKMLPQGTYYLWIISTDGVGNISETVSEAFIVKSPEN